MDNQKGDTVFRVKKYLIEAIKFHKIEEVSFTQTGTPFEVNSESNELISSGKGRLNIEFGGYEGWCDFESPPEDKELTSEDNKFIEMLEKHLSDALIRAMKFNHKGILNHLRHYQDYHRIK